MSPNNTHAIVKTFGIFGEFFLVAPTKAGCLWVVLHVLELFRKYYVTVGNSFSGIITVCNSFSGICQNYFNFYTVLSKQKSAKKILHHGGVCLVSTITFYQESHSIKSQHRLSELQHCFGWSDHNFCIHFRYMVLVNTLHIRISTWNFSAISTLQQWFSSSHALYMYHSICSADSVVTSTAFLRC